MDKATEIIHFNLLLIGVVFVVGGLFLIAGIRLFRSGSHKRFAFALIIFGAIAETLFGPGLIFDRIVITGHGYSVRTGFWFAPKTRQFEFKEVDFITEGFWTDAKGRRNKRWDVHMKNGDILDVPTGDLWRLNKKRIVQLLQERGVRFQ